MPAWIPLAAITIVAFSLIDIFMKLAAPKIHVAFSSLLFSVVAILVMIVYFTYEKLQGAPVMVTKPGGILFACIGGFFAAVATILFFKLLGTGVTISVAAPVVRIGIVVLVAVIGMTLLKERFSVQYLIGMAFAVFGLYLIASVR